MDRKQIKPFLLSIYFLFISISTALRYQTFEDDYTNTLSLELMHRDNFLPYDSNLTPEILLNLRLQRDLLRVQSLSTQVNTQSDIDAASSPVSSGLSSGSGEYLARLGVGTPPQYFYMALDTGSDVVWLQSYPCSNCYTQSDPIFDPDHSSSFSPLSCLSKLCNQLNHHGCIDGSDICTYAVIYGDGSFTKGNFSKETLSFGETSVSNIALGCGNDNEGLFNASAGLLGLGRGRLSFPVQTMDLFGGKFSYCLVDPRSSSSEPSNILFGEQSVSENAGFTPILGNTLYYVNLIGISVGDYTVPGINSSVFVGGVIIDSGTTITRLAEPAYEALKEAFDDKVSGWNRTSGFSTFDTCYNSSSSGPNVSVPTMTLHFDGGADMRLPAENYLVSVSGDKVLCLAFASTSSSELSIIGNFQQQGFRVMYDLKASRVGFAPNPSC
ncbi:hypothetical protein CASFOL_002158 [Castilleja foliolosa]|uniref:Peptidase A1 domain-containing protein n=1 Tax=Castilleja foliolosa TaxID=1961234 RepID=A0ABD3EFD7_9LAMI